MRLLVAVVFLCCLLSTAFARQERPLARYNYADTTDINNLLDRAATLIFKTGELPADLNAAQPLLDSAMARSQRFHYVSGQEKAHKLSVQLAVESLDDRRMRNLLPKLSPATRCELLKRFAVECRERWWLDRGLEYARMMKEEAVRGNLDFVANDAEYYLSIFYHALGQLQKQKECYLNMIKYHQRAGNLANEVIAWEFLNIYLNDLDTTFPTKAYAQNRLLALSQRLDNKLVYAQTLGDIGKSHLSFGRWKEAEQTLLAADSLLMKQGVKERHGIHEALSHLYAARLDLSKSLYYANAIRDSMPGSASSFDKHAYNRAMANLYVNFGRSSGFFEENAKMLAGLDAAAERRLDYIILFSRKIESEQGTQAALDYMLRKMADKNTHIEPGQQVAANIIIGDLYIRLQQTDRGVQYYRIAESVMDPELTGRSNTMSDLYIRLANQYFNLKKYDSSILYLQRIERIPQGMVPLRIQTNMHNLFSRIDSGQGRYQSALHRFKLEKELSDSVFNINKWVQMEELKVKYETAQKDQELKQNAQQISWLTSQSALREALFKQTGIATRQKEILIEKEVLEAQNKVRQREDSLKNKEERILLLNSESLLQRGLLQQTRTTRNVIILAAVLLLVLLLLIYNRYLLKKRNNRELEQQKALLGKLLVEKEWLLKEVHHRVKNNLQVVMSLLNIQSFYLQDDNAISAIRDSQRRVNAISLIHKKLYQSNDPALVDMPLYICELTDYLREFADGHGNIKIELDLAPVSLDVRKALPIGLILNESITNAFKYAFPDKADGLVQISLKDKGDGLMMLLIADNGVGLKRNEEDTSKSLGMSLMDGLAKDMDGALTIESKSGTAICVIFPAALQENGVA